MFRPALQRTRRPIQRTSPSIWSKLCPGRGSRRIWRNPSLEVASRSPSWSRKSPISSAYSLTLRSVRRRHGLHESIPGTPEKGGDGALYIANRLCGDVGLPGDHGVHLHAHAVPDTRAHAGSSVLSDLRAVPADGADHHDAAGCRGAAPADTGNTADVTAYRGFRYPRQMPGKREPHRGHAAA